MLRLTPQLFRHAAEVVRGLWLTPVLFAAAGVGLGIGVPMIDAIPDVYSALSFGWVRSVFDSGGSGARQLLAAGAGALATILGVVFSLTLVTLELAASHYTTHVLARFTDDRVTKLVLGAYIGSVAYLLLVLRSIKEGGEDGGEFVPRIALALGIVLILACLALLAYFLNHLGGTIQSASIVSSVAKRTVETLRELAEAPDADGAPPAPGGEPVRLEATTPGYVQIVDLPRVARAAPERSHVRLAVRPGDFLVPGAAIATVWPGGPLGDDERRDLLRAISIGHVRTEDQDVLFGVERLADIALKALSPSVNDETTAILALNELAVVALAVAAHVGEEADGRRSLRHERTTVTIPAVTLDDVLDAGLRPVCRFAADHPRVLARIAEILAALSEQLHEPASQASLARVAGWVEFALDRHPATPDERAAVERPLREAWPARPPPGPSAASPSVH